MNNKGRLFFVAAVFGAAFFSGAVLADPAFLGMQVQGTSPEILEALGGKAANGVLVRDVALGTPANRAGFMRGDLIVELAGKRIDTFAQLVAVVQSMKAGQKVDAVVERDGSQHQLVLETSRRPKAWSVSKNSVAILPELGMTFAAITPDVRKNYGLRWGSIGVAVTKIDKEKIETIERLIDLKPGDVIVRVNQVDIWHPDQLMRAYAKARKAGRVSLFLLVEGSSQGVRNGFRFSLLPVQ
mgnify:CR=1 FL=1